VEEQRRTFLTSHDRSSIDDSDSRAYVVPVDDQ